MKFLEFLRDAFTVLLKQPKLFLPKLLVSAIYGVSLVLIAIWFKDYSFLLELGASGTLTLQESLLVQDAMPFLLFFIFWSIFSLITDIFVNAMYPAMIKEFKKTKKVSFRTGFESVKSRLSTVFITILILFIPFIIISMAVTSFTYSSFLMLAIALAFALLYSFLFYYIYPVILLEKVSVLAGIKKSLRTSTKNKHLTLKASLFPFVISLFDIYLAFDIFNPVNFFLFVLTRLIIAVVATYHVVLNPVLYLGVRE